MTFLLQEQTCVISCCTWSIMYRAHICLSKRTERELGRTSMWSRVEQNKETEKKRGKEKGLCKIKENYN